MSEPQSSAINRGTDDEYVFPDDGIDWSAVRHIQGDEPTPATAPPRPGSSFSSYGFDNIGPLTDSDVATLNETERLAGLTTDQKQIAPDPRVDLLVKEVYDLLVGTCTCPICHDLFANPYTIMPCGHTMCGSCLLSWGHQSPHLACPVCRPAFDHNISFVRSYVVDEVMDRHTQFLTAHEYPGWEPLGTEILQWTERKTSFRPERLQNFEALLRAATRPLPEAPPPPTRFRFRASVVPRTRPY